MDRRRQIACTRSFGHAITQRADLIEAVSQFASRAAEKLRKQGSKAGQVLAFIHTSPFRRDDKQYSRSITVPLRRPSSDTSLIVQAAVHALTCAFRPGFNYAKAGVMLLDLQDDSVEQHELAFDDGPVDRSALMVAVDALNDRFGRGAIALASTGQTDGKRPWTMKQSLKTPEYTTRWADVPRALA